MAIRPMEMGPVGRRLAANLAALRKRAGLKQQDFAQRLEAAGRPMTASAISRVEQADRRVDVDDLVAFAFALDVTPNRLLLTPDASEEPIELTPTVSVTRERAWQWATGELPLKDAARVYRVEDGRRDLVLGDLGRILERNPHHPPEPMDIEQVLKHAKGLRAVRQAVKGLEEAGLTRRQIFNGLGLLDTLVEARDRLEDLDEG